MFLRTALTEQRITDLEEKMAQVLERLGMVPKEPDEEWAASAPVRDMSEAPSPQPAPEPETPTHASGAAKDRRKKA